MSDERHLMIEALRVVRETVPPTPQQRWPLLDQRVGAQVWVKHENHTAVGAFKLRGGLVYFDNLRRHEPHVYGRIASILLPKDYVRLRLFGERAIDAADASGTLLFDVAHRRWSDEMLTALGHRYHRVYTEAVP